MRLVPVEEEALNELGLADSRVAQKNDLQCIRLGNLERKREDKAKKIVVCFGIKFLKAPLKTHELKASVYNGCYLMSHYITYKAWLACTWGV